MNDALIESTARAWCVASGKDPDKLTPLPRGTSGLVPLWALFEPQARAALAVIAPAVLEEAASLADDYGVDVPNTAPAHQAAWDAADGIRALKARYV